MRRQLKRHSVLCLPDIGRALGFLWYWICSRQCSQGASRLIRFLATRFARAASPRFFWRSIPAPSQTLISSSKLGKLFSIRCVKQRLSTPASLSVTQASRCCSCVRRICGSAFLWTPRYGGGLIPQTKGNRQQGCLCCLSLCFASAG